MGPSTTWTPFQTRNAWLRVPRESPHTTFAATVARNSTGLPGGSAMPTVSTTP
ncbi:hypothetical protein FHS44_002346 [Streptosporangium saharense]|uniref:Uncharacterized protein n=1 Tax=Streptosporangium saharense TaxID=1706840 RepID=A0A7W7QKJ3_9ACTN|nr:hypothetical protein [Streptosporangium saharense]